MRRRGTASDREALAGNDRARRRRALPTGEDVEFVTLTLFDSMDAVRAFAGSELERPVIEPEAQRLLSRIGDRVEHLEVAVAPAR